MSVSPEEVRRIAELARIRLEDESAERLAEDLNGILKHVEKLRRVEVSDVDEAARVTEGPAPFREPGSGPDPMAPGAPGARAPDWRDGFFVVPRIPALEGGPGEGAEDGEGKEP